MKTDNSMMFEVPLERLHELHAAEENILAVYKWLVEELAFPMNMSTDTKPPWLDVARLARMWNERDSWGIPEEDAIAMIYYETGWNAQD